VVIRGIEIRRRVGVAIAAVVIGVVGWHFWTWREVASRAADSGTPEPLVSVAGEGAGNLLREQAEYFDPTPLFLPSPQNFGQGRPASALQRQPDEVFGNFEPRFRFPDQKLAAYGVESNPAPEKAVDTLGRGDLAPFAGMGEMGRPPVTLPARSAFIEVKSLSEGKMVVGRPVDNLALPRVEVRPVEFLVVVSRAGLVGDPLLMVGSGDDAFDGRVREYLVNTFRIGARLGPGNYAVWIGP
jgi:hypothetical protein